MERANPTNMSRYLPFPWKRVALRIDSLPTEREMLASILSPRAVKMKDKELERLQKWNHFFIVDSYPIPTYLSSLSW